MIAPLAISAALLALFGAAHCAAMCGGFVAASFVRLPGTQASAWLAAAPMHAGRLVSYAAAGSLAGAIGATPAMLVGGAIFHAALFSVGALALVVTGLHLAGVRILPAAGGALNPLWRRTVDRVRRLGTPDTLARRLLVGMLWGWAPCAIVYSALPLALASGSPAGGALVMAAFGAGTLPALLGAGWLFRHGLSLSPHPWARRLAGALIVALAVAGILQAFGAADTALGAFCLTPVPWSPAAPGAASP